MIDVRRVIGAQMRSLVDWFGCYDAAAETINTRWGASASKGTICKKMGGYLEWTCADVVALEDASGRYPVTRLLARRLDQRGGGTDRALTEHSGIIAKESGEAIIAILAAEQSCSARETAEAIREVDEAISALRHARKRLEGQGQ